MIDPTYLRTIHDGLLSGTIHKDNASTLPIGLIGIYEETLPAASNVNERKKFLEFFSVWALLKKEVSASFVVPLLEGLTEEQVLDYISKYSKWFNSPVNGKYVLYHERLRSFLLQKIAQRHFTSCNEAIIQNGKNALQTKASDEWERYALEYLSTHLLIHAMKSKDANALKELAYDTAHWNRQVEISKGFEWSKRMLNDMMLWASKYDDDEVIECSLNKVDLHNLEQNDAPRIVELVAQNDIETALQRIEAFGGNDKEGLQRKFILYMLCLMELTLLDSKDKPFRKDAIDRLLKHLDENVPYDKIDWYYEFPVIIVLKLSFIWLENDLIHQKLFNGYKNIIVVEDLDGLDFNSEEKIQFFLQILKLTFDDSVDLFVQFSKILFGLNQLESSILILNEAIKLNSELNDDYNYLSLNFSKIAIQLIHIGNYELGEEILLNRINDVTIKAKTSYNIACIYLKLGELQKKSHFINLTSKIVDTELNNYDYLLAKELIIKISILKGSFDKNLLDTENYGEAFRDIIFTLLDNGYDSIALDQLELLKYGSLIIDSNSQSILQLDDSKINTYCLVSSEVATYFWRKRNFDIKNTLMHNSLSLARDITYLDYKIETLGKISLEFSMQLEFSMAEELIFEILKNDPSNEINSKNEYVFISYTSQEIIKNNLNIFFQKKDTNDTLLFFYELINCIKDQIIIDNLNYFVAEKLFKGNHYIQSSRHLLIKSIRKNNIDRDYTIEQICEKQILTNDFEKALIFLKIIDDYYYKKRAIFNFISNLIANHFFCDALLFLKEYKKYVLTKNFNDEIVISNSKILDQSNKNIENLFNGKEWESNYHDIEEFILLSTDLAIELGKNKNNNPSSFIILKCLDLQQLYPNSISLRFLEKIFLHYIIDRGLNYKALKIVKSIKSQNEQFYFSVFCLYLNIKKDKIDLNKNRFRIISKLLRHIKSFFQQNNFSIILKNIFFKMDVHYKKLDDFEIDKKLSLANTYLDCSKLLSEFNLEFCLKSIESGLEICSGLSDNNGSARVERKYRIIADLFYEFYSLKFYDKNYDVKIIGANYLTNLFINIFTIENSYSKNLALKQILQVCANHNDIDTLIDRINLITDHGVMVQTIREILPNLNICDNWQLLNQLLELINPYSDIDLEIVTYLGRKTFEKLGYFGALIKMDLIDKDEFKFYYKKGIISSLKFENITNEICIDLIKNSTNVESGLELVLTANALNQLFFSNLPQEKHDRYNSSLKLQWAIDIKKELDKIPN
jgi:hypothetical protein